MTDQPSISQEVKSLRTHIVDFLIYRLKNDLITEKRASQLARAVLDHLGYNLSHEQIYSVINKLTTDFPELEKDITSALAASETTQARKTVDEQVLSQIEQGEVDTALATLDKFKIK